MSPYLRRAYVAYGHLRHYCDHLQLTCDSAYGRRVLALRLRVRGERHGYVRYALISEQDNPEKELCYFLEQAEDSVALHAIKASLIEECALAFAVAEGSSHAN
jgi:hypothetical protein